MNRSTSLATPGFLTRSAALQRLISMFHPDASLAPGMAGPRDMPYGVFVVEDVLKGLKVLSLRWDNPEQPVASVSGVGVEPRDATDAELQMVLKHFVEQLQLYMAKRLPWQSSLSPRTLNCQLCQEIMIPG